MKLFKSTLAVLLMMGVAAAGALSSPNGDLDAILNNMQRSAKTIKTIHANIHQERHFGSIGGSEKYDGEIFFRQVGPNADKVRLRYFATGEVSKDLWVNGDRVVFFQPKINQAIETSLQRQAGKKSEFGFIASPYVSVPQLKAKYNVAYVKEDAVAGVQASVLELTPKTASDVTKIVLWVDRRSWLPVQYQVTQRNGDVSTYTLTNMEANGKLPNDTFQVSLPRGVTTIKQ